MFVSYARLSSVGSSCEVANVTERFQYLTCCSCALCSGPVRDSLCPVSAMSGERSITWLSGCAWRPVYTRSISTSGETVLSVIHTGSHAHAVRIYTTNENDRTATRHMKAAEQRLRSVFGARHLELPIVQDSPGQSRNWPTVSCVPGKRDFVPELTYKIKISQYFESQ